MDEQLTAGSYEHIKNEGILNMRVKVVRMIYCPPHFHSDFEFIYVLDRKAQVSSADRTNVFGEDDIAFINPYQFHAVKSVATDCTLLVIQVNPDFCSAQYPKLKLLRTPTFNVRESVSDHAYAGIASACANIGYNYMAGKDGTALLCMSDVYRLFWHILTYMPHEILDENELRAQQKRQTRIRRIVQYMHEHYSERITLSDIAREEGLSLSYASHLFKMQIGMSFQEYLNVLRLDKAVFLMNNTDLDLLDICLSAGFSDPKYMNRHFEKRYHATPKEYRTTMTGYSGNLAPVEDRGNVLESVVPVGQALELLRSHFDYGCDRGVDVGTGVAQKQVASEQ